MFYGTLVYILNSFHNNAPLFPYIIFIPNHTAFLAYTHALHIQLYCVYNLIFIQIELSLWNVQACANACRQKYSCIYKALWVGLWLFSHVQGELEIFSYTCRCPYFHDPRPPLNVLDLMHVDLRQYQGYFCNIMHDTPATSDSGRICLHGKWHFQVLLHSDGVISTKICIRIKHFEPY